MSNWLHEILDAAERDVRAWPKGMRRGVLMTTEAREIDRKNLAMVLWAQRCERQDIEPKASWRGLHPMTKQALFSDIDAILQDIKAQGFRIEKVDE